MSEVSMPEKSMLEVPNVKDYISADAVVSSDNMTPGGEDNILTKGEIVMNKIKTDFHAIEKFITSSVIVLSKNIDVNLKEALSSLLNADPDAKNNAGCAVVSLCATFKSAVNKIDKMFTKHEINKEERDNFKQEILVLYNEVINNFTNDKNIHQLINERLKNTLFETMPIFNIDAEGNPIPVSNEFKKSLISRLKVNIDLSEDVQSKILKDNSFLEEIQSGVKEKVVEYFSVEKGLINKKWFTVDLKQLSEDNLKEFSNAINEIIIDSNNKREARLFQEKDQLSDSVIKLLGNVYNGKELKEHLLKIDSSNLGLLKQKLEEINNPNDNWDKVRNSVKGTQYIQKKMQEALREYSVIKGDTTLIARAEFINLPALKDIEEIKSVNWASRVDLADIPEPSKPYTWTESLTNPFIIVGKYLFGGNLFSKKLISITQKK